MSIFRMLGQQKCPNMILIMQYCPKNYNYTLIVEKMFYFYEYSPNVGTIKVSQPDPNSAILSQSNLARLLLPGRCGGDWRSL